MIAFDCETSGLTDEHVVLSFAAVTEEGHEFYTTIRWDRLLVDVMALKVNSIDLRGFGHQTITEALYNFDDWLTRICGKSIDIIPIGFNVGSFDVRMMNNMCKRVGCNSFFHYRAIDLNSIIMFLGVDKKELVDSIMANELKGQSQHNALTDARLAMTIYKRLKNHGNR